jgi:hypothetical protein
MDGAVGPVLAAYSAKDSLNHIRGAR